MFNKNYNKKNCSTQYLLLRYYEDIIKFNMKKFYNFTRICNYINDIIKKINFFLFLSSTFFIQSVLR